MEVAALRPKTWVYLMDDGSDKEKAKGTRVHNKMRPCLKIIKIACLMKKQYLKNNKDLKTIIMMCSQKEINKVALSINDNKRIQTFDKATIFPQETPTIKVCGNEMLSVLKAKETLTY